MKNYLETAKALEVLMAAHKACRSAKRRATLLSAVSHLLAGYHHGKRI